jgi:hypothetical protein
MQEELDNLAVGVATIFLDGLRTLLFTIPMLSSPPGFCLPGEVQSCGSTASERP